MAWARAMFVILLAAVGSGGHLRAHAQDVEKNPIKAPIKGMAKALGFATDVAPPADFVEKSRPQRDLDYIPVFQPPPEPGKAALNKDQLNAVKGDLDTVQKRDDSLRSTFPPAAAPPAGQKPAKKPKPTASADGNP